MNITSDISNIYYIKYLKYKQKYINLKNKRNKQIKQQGGKNKFSYKKSMLKNILESYDTIQENTNIKSIKKINKKLSNIENINLERCAF
jgi:hypothetical protein